MGTRQVLTLQEREEIALGHARGEVAKSMGDKRSAALRKAKEDETKRKRRTPK